MAKRLPLTDSNGEVRELTKEDLKQFKKADQVLPESLSDILPKRGRPVSAETKKAVSLRLSPEILSAFKSTGRGWQTRINNALRDWLKTHSPDM